jgi:hypothetical protein
LVQQGCWGAQGLDRTGLGDDDVDKVRRDSNKFYNEILNL